MGDLAHGVAESGGVGLPVDGGGAGGDVADVDVAGESAGGAGGDDDGCVDEGEGARDGGGGVGQADAGGDDEDGFPVEFAERVALRLVGTGQQGLRGFVVADGRECVQEGRGLHVHGGLDDGVDADALGESEVHASMVGDEVSSGLARLARGVLLGVWVGRGRVAVLALSAVLARGGFCA